MDSPDFSMTESPDNSSVSSLPILLPPESLHFERKRETVIEETVIQEVIAKEAVVKETADNEAANKEAVSTPASINVEEVRPGRRKKNKREPGDESRAPLWHPTEEQFILIRELAELGWPSVKIVDALNLTSEQFAVAIMNYPRVKAEYEKGVENCKAFPDAQLTWRPMPADVTRVRELAAKGLRPVEIAARMGIGRNSLIFRMNDTPKLRQAFELGEGEFRANLMEDSQKLLDQRNPDLKHVSGLMIFKLKAHCELNDKPEREPLLIEGKIEHKHTLNVPKPVAINDISQFAQIEMERATKLSAEKLKVIEAEIVNDSA